MPRKASGEMYVWDAAKEKKFLQQLDEYLACSGGKHPPVAILHTWATQFNAEFGSVPAHGMTLYQKKKRMKKIYKGWKVLQSQIGLGFDKESDRVICPDDVWHSFVNVHMECNHLQHEGLRYKELYFNVFEKNHTAGVSAYGSVTMHDDSTTYIATDGSCDISGNYTALDDVLTPTTNAFQYTNIQSGSDAGQSRSRGSLGKRKQQDETDDMTLIAMQEIVNHFHSQSSSERSNASSSRTDHMLMNMNIMTEMGIPPNQRCMMWHYFDSRPRFQQTFHRLSDIDRQQIIASVVNSQPPPPPPY